MLPLEYLCILPTIHGHYSHTRDSDLSKESTAVDRSQQHTNRLVYCPLGMLHVIPSFSRSFRYL